MRPVDEALRDALDGTRRPTLVVSDLPIAAGADDVVVRPLRDGPLEARYPTTVLVVADVAELRCAVSALGGPSGLARSRFVGVVVADASAPLLLRPHPSWAGAVDVDARLVDGAAVTTVEFETRVDVVPVLVALARSAASPATTGPSGVWLGGTVAPPADPVFTAAYAADLECPPDVMTAATTSGAGPYDESPVIGRSPLGVVDPGTPYDEAVYNPCGFRREWTRPMVDLPPDTRLSPALVASLRDAQGVRLPAAADERLVIGLALSGVPTEQQSDPAARERASVRTRREALLTHATFAWRSRLGNDAGVRHDLFPGDVTLTTSDPLEVTDLLLARRYSGADLVVLPDDPDGPTECFVAVPPAGAVVHDRDRTPEAIVADGGLVYVTRPVAAG